MKRSFFGPMLFLGVTMLLGGYCGMWSNFQEMKAGENALEAFVARYQNGNNYDALFRAAVAIHEEANFLQSEYCTFPASALTLGMFIVLWAFERRKMFRKYTEMKQQLEEAPLPTSGQPEPGPPVFRAAEELRTSTPS
jgi:hypothetical protein